MVGPEEDRVRIILPVVGGAFGGKGAMFPHDIVSAHLSRITGKPVKIVLSREEVFHATLRRHSMVITLRTGVKRDGTLVCQSLKLLADGGAYAGTGPYQGHGTPQVRFAVESRLDMIAEDLGRVPLDLRQKNFLWRADHIPCDGCPDQCYL